MVFCKSLKNIKKALEWCVKDLNFNRFCTVGPSGHVSTVALFKKIIIFNLTVNFWKQLVTLGLRETFQGWDSSWTWVTLRPSHWYVRLCGAVRAARSWCRCLPSHGRSMTQRVSRGSDLVLLIWKHHVPDGTWSAKERLKCKASWVLLQVFRTYAGNSNA